jgi:flagellar biosynthesis protein FlhF
MRRSVRWGFHRIRKFKMAIHRLNVSKEISHRGNRMMPRAFRARSMPAALAAVEKALGTKALIVSVHSLPTSPAWQVWRHPGVEVVAIPSAVDSLYSDAATPEEPFDPSDTLPAPAAAFPRPADAEGAGASPLPRKSAAPAEPEPSAALDAVQNRLLQQGVDSALVAQTIRSVRASAELRILSDRSLTGELVRQKISRRLRSDGGACLIRRKVIFLIGSSGCGKTSACAKIASYALKALGKRVHWISSDTTRAGAIAKAQAFTAPLGIPLHLTYRPEELPSLLHLDSESELFLVDTAGCNPYRPNELAELERLLDEIPDRHILWVAPATAKQEDLVETHAAFAHLGLGGMVITRLDETRSFGGLFNFLHQIQLPVAFLSNGPRIQGDFQTGESPLLVDLLLGEKTA